MRTYDKDIAKKTARLLRRRQTPAERKLWAAIRNRKLNGWKFQRQYPVPYEYEGYKRFFVADFYCHEARLALELDGGIHRNQVEYDKARTEILETKTIRVFRIKNREIINSYEITLESIKNELFPT
jgi:very-short-patch-repair endonuclease